MSQCYCFCWCFFYCFCSLRWTWTYELGQLPTLTRATATKRLENGCIEKHATLSSLPTLYFFFGVKETKSQFWRKFTLTPLILFLLSFAQCRFLPCQFSESLYLHIVNRDCFCQRPLILSFSLLVGRAFAYLTTIDRGIFVESNSSRQWQCAFALNLGDW